MVMASSYASHFDTNRRHGILPDDGWTQIDRFGTKFLLGRGHQAVGVHCATKVAEIDEIKVIWPGLLVMSKDICPANMHAVAVR